MDTCHCAIGCCGECDSSRRATRAGVQLYGINEVFALLGYYAVLIGSYLPTFQHSLLAPTSRVRPETQVIKNQSTLHNIPEERRPQ
jgi:hypothetical protein